VPSRKMLAATTQRLVNRRRAAAILVLFVLVAGGIVGAIRYKSPAQQEMESLAQFVLDNGRSTYVPVEPLHYFGIPSDDPSVRQITATSETGRGTAIQVRRRKDSGILDVVLLDLRTIAGRYYLTGTHGRLVEAALFDKYPEPIDGAQQRFERELDFWKLWIKDNRKKPARRAASPR
jgi:hypothetical protein